MSPVVIFLLKAGSIWCAEENGDLENGRERRLGLVQRPGIPPAARESRLREVVTRCCDDCAQTLGPREYYVLSCLMGCCAGFLGTGAVFIADAIKSSRKAC